MLNLGNQGYNISGDLNFSVNPVLPTAIPVGQYVTTTSTSSVAPLYIPAQALGFTISGLKPNTRLSIFFDKVNVTPNCTPASYDTDYHTQGAMGSAIVTDSTGTAIGILNITENTFQIGTREFHVFNYVSSSDDFDTLSASHTCEAYAYFKAFNHSNTDSDNSIISTIPAGSTSSTTLTNRGSGTPTTVDPNNPRYDPLCQTFFIGSDMTGGQDGVYIKAVDLYFNTVSATQSFSIDIRTVENGLPTTTILPYSQVTLPASGITGDTTGKTATRFFFDAPVYLRSGYTYAVSAIPGGEVPDYTLWTGVVGHTDSTLGSVNANWGQGTLYTSSTGTNWVAAQNQFLKFNILRAPHVANTATATLVNDDYEFIHYTKTSSVDFQAGEYVYQMPSPLAGFVSVNTSSNVVTFNVAASNGVTTDLTAAFAVNDHILIVGSVPPANTTNHILNWGLFSNAFTAKVTSLNPSNNTITFAYANGATAVAPWANAAAVFFKPAKGTVVITAGSNTVTGTGTRFDQQFSNNISDDSNRVPLIAYWSNGSHDSHEILFPASISNATLMTLRNTPLSSNAAAIPFALPVGRVVVNDKNRRVLVLDKSTSNGSSSNTAWQNAFSTPSYFAPSRVVVGSTSGATVLVKSLTDVVMNSTQPVIYDAAVQGTNITYSLNATSKAYSNVVYPVLSPSQTNYFANNEVIVASKTNEINRNSGLKSVQVNANLSTTSDFLTPTIDSNHSSLLVKSNLIGQYETNESSPHDGTALAKSVSKIVTLGDGNDAEDLNVYLTAYKPAGTQIQVYAKLINASDPDIIANKYWSPLVQVTDNALYSDTSNLSDYKEFQYTLPTDPVTIPTDDLVTTNNSTTIISTGANSAWSTVFSNGQLVTIYTDSSHASYEVHAIASVANNNAIVLSTPVAFSNTSSAVIASMTYPYSAVKNSLNTGIVRYYDSTGTAYDSYKQYAIKIVMLSSNTSCVPKISNMRTLALSV
jgi:hypothetical protein